MRKLYLFLLALTLSIALLTISVVPVMAAKPDPKQPVAWVNSSVNTANDVIKLGIPIKTMHTLEVKLLANGTMEAKYTFQDFITGTKGWAVDNPYYDYGFGNEGKVEFAYFWIDEATGARMADIALYVYMEGFSPEMPAALTRIRICDNGEPGRNDWHQWWYWGGAFNPVWVDEFGGETIYYMHGNAQIHGDLTGMDEPSANDLLPLAYRD